jgi:hypothetical protein
MYGPPLERGITIRKGREHLQASLPHILEDADNKVSGALWVLLTQLQWEMQYLHRQIEECDKLIVRIAGELEPCRRLVAIPGIGPLIATATLERQAANLVDHRSAAHHPPFTHSVQRLQVWSSLSIGTKRIVGRVTASAMALASM